MAIIAFSLILISIGCLGDNLDSDGDGLTDRKEKILGTDPFMWDTDNDGLSDKEDVYPLKSMYGENEKEPIIEAIEEPADVSHVMENVTEKNLFLKWSLKTDGDIYQPPAVSEDGVVYIAGTDNNIYQIDSQGNLLKKFETQGPATSLDATWEGILYFVDKNNLYAMSQDGDIHWDFSTGGISSLAVTKNGSMNFITNDVLYSLSSYGVPLWNIRTAASNTKPVASPDGTVYMGSERNILYAVDPKGNLKWTHSGGTSSPVIGTDGTIYVGSRSQNLYAINPDGTEKWKYPIFGVLSSPVLDEQGMVYLVASDRNIYAFRPEGNLKWKKEIRMGDVAHLVKGPYDLIIIGTRGGIYALDSKGEQKWAFEKPGVIFFPSMAADGTLYATSQGDGMVYAFGYS